LRDRVGNVYRPADRQEVVARVVANWPVSTGIEGGAGNPTLSLLLGVADSGYAAVGTVPFLRERSVT
jgi:hypothetical protein